MKLTVAAALALVTLSVLCSPASAEICPSFLQALEALLVGSVSDYEAAIAMFMPEKDMKDAGVYLKIQIDSFPPQTKKGLQKLMQKMATSPLCSEDSQAEDLHPQKP
ncbi:uteroglobin-like [Erinaceus europaeus]|uniref:Uteroglobin n=1 Tax=Erinaceus europaeus TaxID=9365 RepID=A0ABM3WA35_ERIEU|nr:uteroglobin-like [Erinaceus europaeus]